MFYGVLLGAATASLIIAARNVAVLLVFGIGYLFVFSILLLAIKLETKPIRLGSTFVKAVCLAGCVYAAILVGLSLLP